MKRALAFKFKLMADPKDIRRVVAMITGEVISDEDLDKQFFDREPIEIRTPEDVKESDMVAAFVALMLVADLEATQKPREGKFFKKMREMQEEADKNKV